MPLLKPPQKSLLGRTVLVKQKNAKARFPDHPHMNGYPPIGYHGMIGDTHTAGLVGMDASVDWYCYPHFDDSPVFASLLDSQKGGRFSIDVQDGKPLRQLYLPDTNVLLTRMLGPTGAMEVLDMSPIREDTVKDENRHWHGLVRQVRAVSGEVHARLSCRPTFDYARVAPKMTRTPRGVMFEGAGKRMELVAPVPLEIHEGGPGEAGVTAEFIARPDEPFWFVLCDPDEGDPWGYDPRSTSDMARLMADTLLYWRNWADRCNYQGRWQTHVLRSALTLKLLTYSPTGAIVAAPTMSLPESLGGERNWDYRFTWLRDAAFTLRALFRLGYDEEGRAFFNWLSKRVRRTETGSPVQPLYSIHGDPELTEEHLDHLDGYRGSKPVRKGNAAHQQLQLDVFGEIMETLFDYAKRTGHPGELWDHAVPLLDWLSVHWRDPDAGIWEIRGPPRHFVHSKMMCWVAFDRAVRLAEEYDLGGDIERWRTQRDELRRHILTRGVHPTKRYFTQTFDNQALDASNILIPLYGFLPPEDHRVKATLEATRRSLASGGLVRRYHNDRSFEGVNGPEGAFSLCFFWLTDNMILQGDLDEAWLSFELYLTYANHLQLFAEQVDTNGESLGNFPQAFTHIGLIYSALLLDRTLKERQNGNGRRNGTTRR